MRKLLNTSILVFAFCFCAFGQTDKISPCPTISLTGPAGIAQPNESILFTLSVDEKAKNYDIKYNWTISRGKVVGGQGTATLSVLPNPGEGMTAAIEISGLPGDCANTASETYMYCIGIQPTQIDVFSEPFTQIDKNRISEIVHSIQNDLSAQLYMIFRHKEKTSPKMASRKEREISNSLVKAGLAADRITTVTGFGQSDSIEFWLVPAGATPPKIEDN
jgi:hypothetical protein